MAQRFRMFPEAATSFGLVLLRLSVAATLHLDPFGELVPARPDWYFVALCVCSGALGVGFLTPLFATMAVVVESIAFVGVRGESLVPAVAAVTAATLALLGPGAYSLDARLFGRRTVVMTMHSDPNSRE